ncbi:hypothetical protein [Pseudodesulfovibrio sediminis]|uniref:Uncharacterized protein n=1 Tax=Pseudodesulfovibrio sediminis TaxID=2810563 RepID=A0ABM7P3I4_9BACT|nr:hypothetical protein [Pseudodesulfovibrio sediminis]BCS87339.1 hypothetical protein PSDVSF_05810 [Pseudodesulfovibrio sediminis]
MCGSISNLFPKDMSLFEKVVSGVTAAGAVATTASGLMNSGAKVTSAPRAVDTSAADAEAMQNRQRALAKRSKTKSTNLTGGLGVKSPANVGLKTLFGGN